jgi:hypothetical protein
VLQAFKFANINILFELDAGVRVAVSPKSCPPENEASSCPIFVPEITCRIHPVGKAPAGKPVALVKTKADGVPKLGVVKTGLVKLKGAFKPAWFIVEIAIIYPIK